MESSNGIYEAGTGASTGEPPAAEKPKPARSSGGLFAKKEPAAAKEPKPRKVEYIGVEEPAKKRGRPAGAASGAAGKMTPKKAQSLVSAACTVASLVTRNRAYMLTAEDVAYNKETFEQISDGVNGLPDWLKAGVSQGGSTAGLVAALVGFGYTKHILATSGLTYADLAAAVAETAAA